MGSRIYKIRWTVSFDRFNRLFRWTVSLDGFVGRFRSTVSSDRFVRPFRPQVGKVSFKCFGFCQLRGDGKVQRVVRTFSLHIVFWVSTSIL